MAEKQGFKLFGLIIAIIAVTDIAILLDIPFLRQILGTLFLTILPGLLILFLLKLNKLGIAEKIVLTIGLSIAFLMFYGWLVNQACLVFDYTSPLSTNTIVLWLSPALIALLVTAYLTNKEAFTSFPFSFELNTKGKLCLILPVAFPLLSIWGVRLLNTSGNNTVLLIPLLLIPVSIILITLLRREISKDTYPIAIIMTGVALLLICWLRSEHIMGADTHYSYYLSHTTLLNQHWSLIDYGNVDAMLGVTILPAIYQSLLQMQGEEYLFKGIFVLICTFTPLTIYLIAKKYIGELYALLAALFFISQVSFWAAPMGPRVSLAIFFFALAIMVLFSNSIRGANRRGLFIAFIAATVVSHYTTTYIFFFLLLFTWLLGLALTRYHFSKTITLTSVCLFLAVIFLWYSQLTQSPFTSGVTFFNQLIRNLADFATLEAMSPELQLLVARGLEGEIFLVNAKYVLTWVTFAFIAIGVIGTLIKRRQMLSAPPWGNSPSGQMSSRFETEFFLLAVVSCGILVASIAIPYTSQVYGMRRVYGVMLIILSPFFILGGITLAKYCRLNSHLLILLVLIPYFLLATGTAYETFGFDREVLLSSQAPAYITEVVHDKEASSMQWLKEYREPNAKFYVISGNPWKLVSQGFIHWKQTEDYRSPEKQEKPIGQGYIYYSQYDRVDIDEHSELLIGRSKLYTNGGAEVYK